MDDTDSKQPKGASNRTLITLLCSVVGIGASFTAYRVLRGGQQATIEFIEPELKQSKEGLGKKVRYIKNFPDSTLVRVTMNEKLAKLVFPQLQHSSNQWDPLSYFGYPPNFDQVVEFSAHPDGRYRVKTNSLGMRRDSEPSPTKPDTRILVAGDSHADGVGTNAENFTTLLEGMFNEDAGPVVTEVLNACRGGGTPYTYLGTLEKFVDLKPDVFLVWFTGSNDFVDMLFLGKVFEQRPRVGLSVEDEVRRTSARELNHAVYTSGPHSAFYLTVRPEDQELSLKLARDILREITLICTRDGIQPQLVFMPSPGFLIPPDGCQVLGKIIDQLGIPMEELEAQARSMEAALTGICDEFAIPMLNLRECLQEDPEVSFFKEDLHLNPHGHRIVAKALHAWMQSQ